MPRAVENSVLERRRAGVLLHVTSLPGDAGGDLGENAFRFVDFLADCGLSVWQVLPVGPTHSDGSPYQCLSAHAGNPELISLDWLMRRGWLVEERVAQDKTTAAGRAALLSAAHEAFRACGGGDLAGDYERFVRFHAYWLEDYALFMALKGCFQDEVWWKWPLKYRLRDADSLIRIRGRLGNEIDRIRFEQFVFFQQWRELRQYAHRRGVLLFGDMPIFVAADSADVWAKRRYFRLNDQGKPTVVAGVPPDYFSATGQRWGNPHYDWQAMEEDGFTWWIERMHTQLEMFDWVRIDHFRGFEACWEIPAESDTAVQGRWVKAPGEALLEAVHARFGQLPLVAENLGIITPEVETLRRKFGIPGMLVLQFAFEGGAGNPYLPHNHTIDNVVYTGTHDNDTSLGWFESLDPGGRTYLYDYLGQPGASMPEALVRCAFASVAVLVVLPMQDVLGLGSDQRMNTPGTTANNWRWRFSWDQLQSRHGDRLKHWVHLYGRG
ncbi:4-alpha-glucanotransferase [Methylohalobius crimeensis]|uniref:4-alpha-glucanotransferase n=1 Tax=Methylohalobius crimeensis TaxID=244365 RepID=UPI0003B3611B|nr:4-alpha-glucanotransferase [Methylohalobius crimeensis]